MRGFAAVSRSSTSGRPRRCPSRRAGCWSSALILVVIAAVVRRRIDVSLSARLHRACSRSSSRRSLGHGQSLYIRIFACSSLRRAFRSLACVSVAAAGVLVVFFAFMPPTETRAEVRRWRAEEQQHAEIVLLVAELERSGCTVATTDLDLETALALPVLVALESSAKVRECAPNAAYLVLPSSTNETLALLRACAPGRLEPILVGRLVGVNECTQLRSRAKALLDAHRLEGA